MRNGQWTKQAIHGGKRGAPAGTLRTLFAALAALCALSLPGCADRYESVQTSAPSPAATLATTHAPTPAPTPEPTPTAEPTRKPVALTAFRPDRFGKGLERVETVLAEDTPMAILDELVRLEAIPDVDYGRSVYFEAGDGYVKKKNGEQMARVVARMDVSSRLQGALADMTEKQEALFLQALANTFLTHYGVEVFLLTLDGVKLETSTRDYERGFTFDQYAKTVQTE